jgi:carboxyl-terminal processing protease
MLVSVMVGALLGRQQGIRSVVPTGEGRVLNQGGTSSSRLSGDVDFALFWDAWDLLKDRYYQQPVSDKTLFYGSMEGLLNALGDPYTAFFDPEQASEFLQDLSGAFEGIGAEIGIKDEQLIIVAPLSGSPAEQAGLKPGDAIYRIDGTDTTGITVEEAVFKIRGEHGTTVTLTIGRDGLGDIMDVAIVRDIITIESVRLTMREDGIAVVSIFTFNEDTMPLFTAAVNDLLLAGARGVILDLRSNPGGLLTAAIDVGSAWIGAEPVVIQSVRGRQDVFAGSGDPRLRSIPTVALVNGGSASGAEIVAGALQDYGYAMLVGTQTFGKGSVQDYQELEDGSALKITTAEWLTPLGRSINHVGIAPDVVVEVTQEDVDVLRDPQMGKAVELLGNL